MLLLSSILLLVVLETCSGYANSAMHETQTVSTDNNIAPYIQSILSEESSRPVAALVSYITIVIGSKDASTTPSSHSQATSSKALITSITHTGGSVTSLSVFNGTREVNGNSTGTEDTSSTSRKPQVTTVWQACHSSFVAYSDAVSQSWFNYSYSTVTEPSWSSIKTSTQFNYFGTASVYTTISGFPHVVDGYFTTTSKDTITEFSTIVHPARTETLTFMNITSPSCSIGTADCHSLWRTYFKSLGLPTWDLANATEPSISPTPRNRPNCEIGRASWSCSKAQDAFGSNCWIVGNSVRLLYWPSTRSTMDVETSTRREKPQVITARYGSYTLTSPSVYIDIASMMAWSFAPTFADCSAHSPLGAVIHPFRPTTSSLYDVLTANGFLISLKPEEVSSIIFDVGDTSSVISSIARFGPGPSGLQFSSQLTRQVIFSNLHQPSPEEYYLNVQPAYLNPGNPCPECGYIFDRAYAPALSVHDALYRSLPEQWKRCDWSAVTLNDPPSALRPEPSIAAPTVPDAGIVTATGPDLFSSATDTPSASPGSPFPSAIPQSTAQPPQPSPTTETSLDAPSDGPSGAASDAPSAVWETPTAPIGIASLLSTTGDPATEPGLTGQSVDLFTVISFIDPASFADPDIPAATFADPGVESANAPLSSLSSASPPATDALPPTVPHIDEPSSPSFIIGPEILPFSPETTVVTDNTGTHTSTNPSILTLDGTTMSVSGPAITLDGETLTAGAEGVAVVTDPTSAENVSVPDPSQTPATGASDPIETAVSGDPATGGLPVHPGGSQASSPDSVSADAALSLAQAGTSTLPPDRGQDAGVPVRTVTATVTGVVHSGAVRLGLWKGLMGILTGAGFVISVLVL